MLPNGVIKFLFVNIKWVRELIKKVKYSPTMYVPVQKETKYKTLDGKFATP